MGSAWIKVVGMRIFYHSHCRCLLTADSGYRDTNLSVAYCLFLILRGGCDLLLHAEWHQ